MRKSSFEVLRASSKLRAVRLRAIPCFGYFRGHIVDEPQPADAPPRAHQPGLWGQDRRDADLLKTASTAGRARLQ
jgi:hypothetical protein